MTSIPPIIDFGTESPTPSFSPNALKPSRPEVVIRLTSDTGKQKLKLTGKLCLSQLTVVVEESGNGHQLTNGANVVRSQAKTNNLARNANKYPRLDFGIRNIR